jgi:WD40 repeat protein
VAFSPDGKRLASASGYTRPGELRLWDYLTGNELQSLNWETGSLDNIAFSPDGKRLASTSYDHKVLVWTLQE